MGPPGICTRKPYSGFGLFLGKQRKIPRICLLERSFGFSMGSRWPGPEKMLGGWLNADMGAGPGRGRGQGDRWCPVVHEQKGAVRRWSCDNWASISAQASLGHSPLSERTQDSRTPRCSIMASSCLLSPFNSHWLTQLGLWSFAFL